MKKIIVVVLFLLLLPNIRLVDAHEISATVLSATTSSSVEYTLPYPGLLPGHPFYILKNIRDGILGFFISNPLKKAEFSLHQADKNIAASELLFNQKKDSALIFQAISRAKAHFKDVLKNSVDAKKQGMYTAEFASKITIANLKHQEVALSLLKSAKEDDKKRFETELEEIEVLGVSAKNIKP